MGHSHGVLDKDTHFIIDPVTRAITTSSEKLHVMQYDHNSETLTFEMPRYIEGHDMSLCNKVEAHFLNIDTKTKDQISGHRELKDFRVSEEDENKVIVSWTITKGSTKLGGLLHFLLNFRCMDGDVETYAWHTDFFKNYTVKGGLDAAALFESEYVDVIEQWKASVMQHFTDDLATWKKEAQAEVKAEVSKEIAVERERINNIVALKDGSTTGDAELKDVRVDVNGTTHATAGDAVREQIKDVASGIGTKTSFLDRMVKSYNMHNTEASTKGFFLSTDDAIIEIADPAYCFTDYIPVLKDEVVIACHPWGAQYSLSWYDREKNLIGQRSYTEDIALEDIEPNISKTYWYAFTVPENTAFVRVNNKLTGTVKEMIVKGSCASDIPTEYVEYKAILESGVFVKVISDEVKEKMGVVNTEENTVLGHGALPITEGIKHNVAIGANSLSNVVVDNEADNQSGKYNVAVGGSAMKQTTTGNHNTACGFQAMLDNTTGTANTAVGEDALMTNSAGNCNVAVGCRALQSATEGDDNVAIGQGAGYWNDNMHPTGSRNTMIGAHSGQADGAGSDNVAIGYFAKATNGLNHTIVIGNNTMATKEGQTIIGTNDTVETVVRGDLIVQGSDGTKRQIVFKKDGSCSWEIVG